MKYELPSSFYNHHTFVIGLEILSVILNIMVGTFTYIVINSFILSKISIYYLLIEWFLLVLGSM